MHDHFALLISFFSHSISQVQDHINNRIKKRTEKSPIILKRSHNISLLIKLMSRHGRDIELALGNKPQTFKLFNIIPRAKMHWHNRLYDAIFVIKMVLWAVRWPATGAWCIKMKTSFFMMKHNDSNLSSSVFLVCDTQCPLGQQTPTQTCR